MTSDSRRKRSGTSLYRYYRCETKHQRGAAACPLPRSYRAEQVEEAVWDYVSRLLTEPEQLVTELDRLIEEECSRTGDPERRERALRRKLVELDERQMNAQSAAVRELLAKGLIEEGVLRAQLEEISETRRGIEHELEACKNHTSRIAELKAMRDFWAKRGELWETLDEIREWTAVQHADETADRYQVRLRAAGDYENRLHDMQDKARKARLSDLQHATPEQRRNVYRNLDLRVAARPEGGILLTCVFGRKSVCINTTTSSCAARPAPAR